MTFTTRIRRWLRKNDSGQSIILLAIGFVALASFVGITTDISLMFVRYSQLARAVDSAAIAAANQMRSDRSIASVSLAARQMIEFHGINPIDVLVDTCQSIPIDQRPTDELCRGDQSKLVRVTAQIISPTAFLRLVGWRDFRLQASSLSETATLDVVLIMDVSERMARYTTIEDWARIGLGVVYIPSSADEVYDRKYGNPAPASAPDRNAFWRGDGPNAVRQDSLLAVSQAVVNNRLEYAGGVPATPPGKCGNVVNGQVSWGDSCALNRPTSETAYRVYFDANYFNLPAGDTSSPFFNDRKYGQQYHPRQQCRVRFWPYAARQFPYQWYGLYDEDTRQYVSLLQPGGSPPPPSVISGLVGAPNRVFFDGFIPTYNWFGCCNDPNGDGNFEDLVCQPFRQARDATLQFLERIDFTRGDRVAFVTYDRSAFLVNPYGYYGLTMTEAQTAYNTRDEDKRLGGMIDNAEDARTTLVNLIGVRAEPNFYVYDEGFYNNSAARLTARWTGYAAFVNADTGRSQPVDFGAYPNPNDINFLNFATAASANANATVPPEGYIYPAYGACPFDNAALVFPRTVFLNGMWNAGMPNESTNPNNPYDPNPVSNSAWVNYVVTHSQGTRPLYPRDANNNIVGYDNTMSYDYWASCRTGNVGAALREANNALINPRTTRQSGTVWVMVMLSSGGAGASDPVRRNRQPLTPSDPYKYRITNTSTGAGAFGLRGQYGAFGVCPFGTVANPGELMTTANEPFAVAKPVCADESPMTRRFCNFRPNFTFPGVSDTLPEVKRIVGGVERTVPPLGDRDYTFFGENDRLNSTRPGPPSSDQELNWNRLNNRLYDVDLMVRSPANNNNDWCDFLYDTDDYARDWADYIGLRRSEGDANTLLTTVFTIGFGLEYLRRTEGAMTYTIGNPDHTRKLCELNAEDCIGEELLRYIADVGDNNQMDHDFWQDILEDKNPVPQGFLLNSDFGVRGPCQTNDGPQPNNPTTYADDLPGDPNSMSADEQWRMYGMLPPQQACGNYYYAPDANGLQAVFNDIASRMFTRLSR